MLEAFMERALGFLLFWGVWLLAPLLIDISTALVYFVSLLTHREKNEERKTELSYYPIVTVVVPVHNSADTATGKGAHWMSPLSGKQSAAEPMPQR